jgi:hypothetical protein
MTWELVELLNTVIDDLVKLIQSAPKVVEDFASG